MELYKPVSLETQQTNNTWRKETDNKKHFHQET